jgi:CheY-like chemotaxis protein
MSRHKENAQQLQLALKSLGYGRIVSVSTHGQALERINSIAHGKKFSFVLFDAKDSDIGAHDFVKAALHLEADSILIPTSHEPHIDDVFGLLREGARAFLVLPFTPEVLEDISESAQEGAPFSASVLRAKDRNIALVGVVLHCLYRLAVSMRLARKNPSRNSEVEAFRNAFHESVDLARMFCMDGDKERLRETIIEECEKRANIASTRIGRTRRKLAQKRDGALGALRPPEDLVVG